MNDVITLDLNEVADEWQEVVSEMEANVPNTEGMSWGEVAEATEAFMRAPEQVAGQAQYIELCEQLGGSPVEPDTLRFLARTISSPIIRDDTFTDYAREFAEDMHGDLGALESFINWEAYASSVRQDYYELTYDGHEWLRRA